MDGNILTNQIINHRNQSGEEILTIVSTVKPEGQFIASAISFEEIVSLRYPESEWNNSKKKQIKVKQKNTEFLLNIAN